MLTNVANWLQHHSRSVGAWSGAIVWVHGQRKVEADVVRVQNASVKFKVKVAAVKVVIGNDIQIAVDAVGVIAGLRDWVCESDRVGRENAESGGETFALRHGMVTHGSHYAHRVASDENISLK